MHPTLERLRNKRIKYWRSFKIGLSRILVPIRQVKALHENLKSLTEEDIDEQPSLNQYQVFFFWLLEVVQYGTLATISYGVVFHTGGWPKWILLPFAIGIMRWLYLDTLKQTMERVRK